MATTALLTARASAPSGETIIQTLELRHPLWPTPYYLTNYPRAFTTLLETGVRVSDCADPFGDELPPAFSGGTVALASLTGAVRVSVGAGCSGSADTSVGTWFHRTSSPEE